MPPLCWAGLDVLSDDRVPRQKHFYLTPGGRTVLRGGTCSLKELPYTHRCSTRVFSLWLCFMQHSSVLLRWWFCLSGICVSANQTQIFFLRANCLYHCFHSPSFAILLYRGRERPSLSVTFPVSLAVAVYRLGNCDKHTRWCHKGFGEGWRSRNSFTPTNEIMSWIGWEFFYRFSQSSVNVLYS